MYSSCDSAQRLLESRKLCQVGCQRSSATPGVKETMSGRSETLGINLTVRKVFKGAHRFLEPRKLCQVGHQRSSATPGVKEIMSGRSETLGVDLTVRKVFKGA